MSKDRLPHLEHEQSENLDFEKINTIKTITQIIVAYVARADHKQISNNTKAQFFSFFFFDCLKESYLVGLWGITWLRLIIPINRFDPAFPCVPFLEGSREIWCLPHLLSSSIGLLPFFPISTGWSLPPFLLRCLPLPLPPSFGYQGGRLCSALNLAHSIAPPLLTMGTSGAPAVDPDLQPTMHKPRGGGDL